MHTSFNEKIDLLIVGAGIFGSSTAYYFKRDNPDKEVVVLEQNEICSGNTGLAAALMSKVRPYEKVIPLSQETYKVIPELEKITGTKIPIQYTGSLHIAVSNETIKKLTKLVDNATIFSIPHREIKPEKAQQMVPWLNASMASKIIYFPDEAITDPYLLCMAFANAAKSLGVRFVKKTAVSNLCRLGNQIAGAETDTHTYYAQITILASGVWSSTLAEKVGIHLPMAPVRSQYWITETSSSKFPSTMPSVLIPEARFYSRPFGNSLLFGIREPNSIYLDPRKLPDNIANYPFNKEMGWDDLEENYLDLLPFFPTFEDIPIKNYVAGFSAYTPDNQFILGKVPGVDGLLLATGGVGAGISVSGGIGLGISCLAANKQSPFDFSPYLVNRFGSFDPFSVAHLSKCAAARSSKISG